MTENLEMQTELESITAIAIEQASQLLSNDSRTAEIVNRGLRVAIQEALRERERQMKNMEEASAREAKNSKWFNLCKVTLAEVMRALPEEWKPELKVYRPSWGYDRCEIILSDRTKIRLEERTDNSRWSSRVIGHKLVVDGGYGNRQSYPRKKDGSFSIDKIVEHIRAKMSERKMRSEQMQASINLEEQFKKAVQPFKDFVYGKQTTIGNLTISINEDGTFVLVRRQVSTVTAEELTAILEKEVGHKEEVS